MIDAADRLFLRRAVELAERGLFSIAENPRMGCVIVRDGAVIGRGWHQRTGGLHAEAAAIANAGGTFAVPRCTSRWNLAATPVANHLAPTR